MKQKDKKIKKQIIDLEKAWLNVEESMLDLPLRTLKSKRVTNELNKVIEAIDNKIKNVKR